MLTYWKYYIIKLPEGQQYGYAVAFDWLKAGALLSTSGSF